MFELYTRFFDHLAERTAFIQQALGPQTERFASLLNKQPDPADSDFGRKFEKYLKNLIRFALTNSVIDPELLESFKSSGILKPLAQGFKIVLNPGSAEFKLTTRKIAQMRRTLKGAAVLASRLEAMGTLIGPDVPLHALPGAGIKFDSIISNWSYGEKSNEHYYHSSPSPLSGHITFEGTPDTPPTDDLLGHIQGRPSLFRPSGFGVVGGAISNGTSWPGAHYAGTGSDQPKGSSPSSSHLGPANPAAREPAPVTNGGSKGESFPVSQPAANGSSDAHINPPPAPGDGSEAVDGQSTPRSINVTGYKLDGSSVMRFSTGVTYKLQFNVGSPVEWNLASGNTEVKDIPSQGLKTRWMVRSTGVTFVSEHSSEIVSVEKKDNTWLAKFNLIIPERGESITLALGVIPGADDRILQVDIFAVDADGRLDPYRELTVRLSGPGRVVSDVTWTEPKQTHLAPAHEWMTPAIHIQISIKSGSAEVTTKRARLQLYEFSEPFTGAGLKGSIDNVRDSLEQLREKFGDYFDDVDSVDLATHLKSEPWRPDIQSDAEGWGPLPSAADEKHKAAFAIMRASDEWRQLASDGHALYENCFPHDTDLRKLLDTMPPGSRIDFHWTEQSGPGWISHVPWALMFMEPVGGVEEGLPEAEKFFGLRYRIGTRSWSVPNGSRVMGDLATAHAMQLLYWGDKPKDGVAVESRWQDGEYSAWKWSRKLPDTALGNLKQQLVAALDRPAPAPVAVLYFYCHCTVGDGEQPCLRFGNTLKREDTLSRVDLRGKLLPDAPLVFVNACTTSQADPYMTSVLEETFFKRGVRAFIGTETKVPIQLASKFAWLYFQFLYRRADPDAAPMAAGEALTQARIFLWTQFKNVGGLFYSMTNQYELFLASEAEVLALQH